MAEKEQEKEKERDPRLRKRRTEAALPVALMTDKSLIPADLVIGLALVAAIPPGQWQITASDPLLRSICKYKWRAIYESLNRLADAGWIALSPGPKPATGGSARIVTPLWPQPESDDDAEGGEG